MHILPMLFIFDIPPLPYLLTGIVPYISVFFYAPLSVLQFCQVIQVLMVCGLVRHASEARTQSMI